MLLLDYWPLARFGQGVAFRRFVWEKIPFLVLSAASSYITVVVQQAGGAVMPLSIGARIANAFVSYACYVRDTFWPTVLALPYPHPGEWPMAQVTVATVFVLGISIIVVWSGRRYPYLFWGWTWFLGTMIPVIGLVQVGGQARADRYTYIPLIGVFVMISWGLGEFATKWHWKRPIITVCATLILTACALRTSDQLAYWSNTELLFQHTLSVTRDNYLALKYLGFQFASEGRLDEAVAYYRDSLRIRPGFGDTLNDLGNVLVQKKQYVEAEDQFQTALRADPGFLPAHYNFANLLVTLGRTNEAIEHFETVLRSKPDHSATRYQLGCVMTATGRQQEAIIQFETLLKLEPDYPDARHRLGSVLSDRGEWDDAIRQLRLAAKQKRDAPDVENDLAVALSKSGLFDEAIIHFRRVTQLSPNVASAHNNLANALVEAGKLSEAMREYNEALRLNSNALMTHVNLAFLLVKLDRQDEAILHLNEALRLKPDCEQAKEQLRKLRP
jgi:tetratricopeptide (TPR) repeat protein